MSQWTHVHGIIRVDSMIGLIIDGSVEGAIRQVFSCPPSGSEGPLRVDVMQTREGSSISWGYAAITGDLRDFGIKNVDDIENWLRQGVEGLKSRNCTVRDFVLACNVEYGPDIVFWGDHEKFIRYQHDREPKEIGG